MFDTLVILPEDAFAAADLKISRAELRLAEFTLSFTRCSFFIVNVATRARAGVIRPSVRTKKKKKTSQIQFPS